VDSIIDSAFNAAKADFLINRLILRYNIAQNGYEVLVLVRIDKNKFLKIIDDIVQDTNIPLRDAQVYNQ